jgi:hypothetical protein
MIVVSPWVVAEHERAAAVAEAALAAAKEAHLSRENSIAEREAKANSASTMAGEQTTDAKRRADKARDAAQAAVHASTAQAQREREWVWPDGYCNCTPRHPTHFEPSSLELNGTLRRDEQYLPDSTFFQRALNPRFLSYVHLRAAYDVASIIRQALRVGHRRNRRASGLDRPCCRVDSRRESCGCC